MRIIHALEKQFIVQKDIKDQEQLGLLLTNNSGGFLWLDGNPASRYQGWFFSPADTRGKKMIRVLESIEVSGSGPVEELRNNFYSFDRKRGDLAESFFLPPGLDGLVYETNRKVTCDLHFDVAECSDHGDWDRYYNITREDGYTVIEYSRPGLPGGKLFIALRFDGGDNGSAPDWVRRDYAYDHSRNSPPYERYVYRALNVTASKVVMAVSNDPVEAKRAACFIYQNCERLKQAKKKECVGSFRDFLQNGSIKEKQLKNKDLIANAFCALTSLNSFVVKTGEFSALFAGLPWFYQFWNRDEALCLNALAEFNPEAALSIFSRRLLEMEVFEYKTKTADEAGWFFHRAGRMIRKGLVGSAEKKRVIEALGKTIDRDIAEKTVGGLAFSQSQETWMDSLSRSGARIEIQAMRLMMYRLAKDLAVSPRRKERYAGLETALLRLVRQIFWDGASLADGFDPGSGQADRTVRPNIFLAAYMYPKLLDRDEWISCFKYALPKLWLDWGGLATIDKSSADFQAGHTGENPASYHNGDSWFYLNDIAAVVMGRLDSGRFDHYIKKIFEAGSYDLLWTGISGYAAELSPASRFDSAGSPAQAWTSAAFLELLSEAGQRVIRDRNQ
jgi:hypothetical protein